MASSRATLERIGGRVPVPQPAFDRLMRRRDRRRRNQRIATAVFALILAAAAIGGAVRMLRSAERQLPANRIDRTNVKDLELAWNAGLQGQASSVRFRSQGYVAPYAPTVVGGRAYVGTDTGKVYAFDASCGTEGGACTPSWIGRTGGGIPSPPTVADGMVFVGAQDGHLYAFPTGCGTDGADCTPLWSGETGRVVQSPVVAGGIVYGFDVRGGGIYAFDEGCGTGGATCRPLWSRATHPTRVSPPFIANQVPWRVAVSDGVVFASVRYATGSGSRTRYIDELLALDARSGAVLWSHSEDAPRSAVPAFPTPIVESGSVFMVFGVHLEAFPTRCRTDGASCHPDWTFELKDFGNWMAAADGMVYANTWTSGTEGNVYAFRAHCATGGTTCTPLWTAPDDGYGHLAAGDGYLFATSVFGDALDAFPAACGKGGATCQAAWTARSLGGPRWAPVVSNGVVYVGSADGSVRGFPVRCGTGGATCQPSWTRRVTGSEMSPPAIEGTHLFTVTTDGRLSAFRLPPERAPSSPGPGTLVLYAGLAALVVILLVVRSRRRAH